MEIQEVHPEGLFLCNPPFGERLETIEQAKALYATFPGLCQRFPGWNFSCISTDTELATIMERKPEWTRLIHNGALEIVLYRFAAISPVQDSIA
jgi:putative N6-adenine-specific DNA methylase